MKRYRIYLSNGQFFGTYTFRGIEEVRRFFPGASIKLGTVRL